MLSPSKFSLAILAFNLTSQVLGLSLEPVIQNRHYTEKRDGIVHTIFEDDATGGTMDFVTNSGICETTPGVNQYSGYFSVGSMYPWLPESNNSQIQKIRACGFGFSKLATMHTQRHLLCGSMEALAARP